MASFQNSDLVCSCGHLFTGNRGHASATNWPCGADNCACQRFSRAGTIVNGEYIPYAPHWAQLAQIESSLHDRYDENLADGQDHEACDTPNHCYCPCETCHAARALYLLNTPDTKEDRDRRLLFADSKTASFWITDKHAEIMMAVLKAAGVDRLTPCYAAASSAIKGHQVIDRAFSEGRTVSVSYPAEY